MKNNKKGFTLVELVIVVAVMAVLVAVAIPTVSSIVGEAKTSVLESNARTIESIIKLAEAEADGTAITANATIANALTAAKLGIQADSGKTLTFYYDNGNGMVTYGETAPTASATTAKVFTITFSDAGVVTVTGGTT